MRKPIIALAALAAVVTTSGPTYAATTVVDDGADTASPHDVLTMAVKHTADRVVVRSTYTDLRKVVERGSASTALYLDTRKGRPGPELALVSGLQSGTDYALVRVSGWKLSDRRIDCGHSFKVRWKKNLTKLRVDRECFGERPRVRVSQKMVEVRNDARPVVDWAPGKRKFSAWVTAD